MITEPENRFKTVLYRFLKRLTHAIAARYAFVNLVLLLMVLDENSRAERFEFS